MYLIYLIDDYDCNEPHANLVALFPLDQLDEAKAIAMKVYDEVDKDWERSKSVWIDQVLVGCELADNASRETVWEAHA